MKKWTVEALSLAGIAILLAFLAGFTFLTWQDLKQSRAASDLVDDTHATLAWLGQFRAELYRTELFERSLRDGAPGALAQRDAALDALARQLQGADRLSDAVAGRRARLIQLQQWVRLRILPDTRAARLLGAGQGDAVRDQQDLQDAHLMLDAMLGIEHATLADAELAETRQNDGARNRFLLLILVAGGVIAAILLRIRTLTLARNAAIDLLEHSEHRYRHLLDTAHEGVWLLDNTGRSTFVNERLAHMLGCGAPELLGQPVQAYLGMDAGAALADILRCRAGTVSRSHDLCYRRKNGTRGWALVSGSALASERGEREGSLLMLTDISARKSAEQALARAHAGLEKGIALRTAELVDANDKLRAEIKVRQAAELALAQNETWLQEIISALPVSLFMKDAESRIMLMNAACEQQWGMRLGELSGTRGSAWFAPEQLVGFLAEDQAAFAAGRPIEAERVAWNVGLNQERVVRTIKKPLYDAQGRPRFLIGISIDITERKRAEDALQHSYQQLRQLNEHLETIKEDERKRIAQGIHDELGQNLMALKIDLSMLHARTAVSRSPLNDKVERALGTIDATIGSVRAIINELHPSTLALGLPAALEWLLAQFERRSGIAGRLRVVDDGAEIDSRRTAAIFRIVQESLVNIVRHAQASLVQVSLTVNAAQLFIEIADDGVGMQPGDAGKAAAFGLRGIRERVDAFGGELSIESRRGSGTALTILIPVEQAQPEPAQIE